MVRWKELASISFVLFVALGFGELTHAGTAVKNGTMSVKVQREILNLFGLARKPRPSLNTRLHGRRMSAPRYMIDLYNSLARTASVEREEFCCNNTVSDSRVVGADTIISYLNHVRGARPKISKLHSTFRFKMDTPNGEKITASEFRIFKKPVFSGQTLVSFENSTYILRLYQVVQPAKVLNLLHTRVLRSWETGWQAFDISEAGRAWTKDPNKNFGLELSLETLGHVKLDAPSGGLVGFHGPQEKRPFLVSFYRQDDNQGVTYRRFYQRHRGRSRRSPRRPQFTNAGSSFTDSTIKTCSRQLLEVSFQRLGWQNWIIAPLGYSAFFCFGECSFPLSAHVNATYHAIVQTLVHSMNPSRVPAPCCSPTKLSAISVLYYNDDNNVVLHRYHNMVVQACGCN